MKLVRWCKPLSFGNGDTLIKVEETRGIFRKRIVIGYYLGSSTVWYMLPGLQRSAREYRLVEIWKYIDSGLARKLEDPGLEAEVVSRFAELCP